MPIEEMERWTEIWSRPNLKQEASKICYKEGHQVWNASQFQYRIRSWRWPTGHCDEVCNLVDGREHSQLSEDISDEDCISWVIGFCRPLAKDGEAREKMIPSECLQELGGSNHAHEDRKGGGCKLSQEDDDTGDVCLWNSQPLCKSWVHW